MKNCELFKTEEELNKAYAKRQALLGDRFNTSLLKWACFQSHADKALVYDIGDLVVDKYGRLNVVEGFSTTSCNTPFITCVVDKLEMRLADGRFQRVNANEVKRADIPSSVLDLARGQILASMMAK